MNTAGPERDGSPAPAEVPQGRRRETLLADIGGFTDEADPHRCCLTGYPSAVFRGEVRGPTGDPLSFHLLPRAQQKDVQHVTSASGSGAQRQTRAGRRWRRGSEAAGRCVRGRSSRAYRWPGARLLNRSGERRSSRLPGPPPCSSTVSAHLTRRLSSAAQTLLASTTDLEPEAASSVPCSRLACVFSFCLARRKSRAAFASDVSCKVREVSELRLGRQVLPVSDRQR